MSSFLTGLGSFAGGLAQGIERGQAMNIRQQQADRQRKADELAEEERKKAEQRQALLKQADEAGREVLERLRAEAQAQPQKIEGLDTGDGMVPPIPAPPQSTLPAKPWTPSRRQILQAARARTDKLFELGGLELGLPQWMKDEDMRGQVREQEAETALSVARSGGDLTGPLRSYYELIDDNFDLESAKPTKSVDGKAGYNIVRRRRGGGEEVEFVSREDLVDQLERSVADKRAVAIESLRSKFRRDEIGERGNQTRETDEGRARARLAEINARGGWQVELQDLKNFSAEEIARIKNAGAVTVAELRASIRGGGKGGGKGGGGASVRVQRTINLADGRVVMVMSNGDHKLLVMDDGTPARGLDAEKLLVQVTRDVGNTLDGRMATYPDNRKAAGQQLPAPPAPPTRRPLSSVLDPQQRPAGQQPRNSLDSYLR